MARLPGLSHSNFLTLFITLHYFIPDMIFVGLDPSVRNRVLLVPELPPDLPPQVPQRSGPGAPMSWTAAGSLDKFSKICF